MNCKCCCKKPLLAFISLLVLSLCSLNQAQAQSSLNLGELIFISYNSDQSVPAGTEADQFGFLTLTNIAPGTLLSFTDRGWTSSTGFAPASTGESTIMVNFTQALSPGDQVYIDAAGNVLNQNGTVVGNYTGTPLSLDPAGDQIFVYQGAEPTPANQTNFISAIQMNGGWDANGSTSQNSAQPTTFTDGLNSISLNPEVDNATYNFSIVSGSSTTVSNAVLDPTNWTTNDSMGIAPQDGNFSIGTQVSQTSLSPGDIAFTSYNSDPTVPAGTGTDQFGFVTFEGITPGTEISFTDRGWTTSSGFNPPSAGESTITVTFTQTLLPGDQVYIDADGNVLNQNGTTVGFYTGTPLNLTTAGDQIFAYQGTEPTPADQSGFISAIQMNGSWDAEGTSSASSAQPTVLTDGVSSISLNPEVDNATYNFSVVEGSTTTISSAVFDATNWTTNNNTGFAAQDGNFTVTDGGSSTTCTLEIACVAPLVTASCAAPPADVSLITVIQSCGDLTITSTDVETGNILDGTFTIMRTYTVIDNNGTTITTDDLELSCLQRIEIQTPALPQFSCIDGQDVTCVADITPVEPQLTVECGNATVETSGIALTAGMPNCLGSIYTVTYTATDQFGRIATCEQNFTINNSFPAVDCPADRNITCVDSFVADMPSFTISCGGDGATAVSTPVLVEGNANCDGAIYEVTYSVTDNCDRTTDCIQRLTLVGDAPTISCASIPATANCEEAALSFAPDFTVSCGSGTVSATLSLASGSANCDGAQYEVTYTITDDCGRTASCVQSIQLINDAPEIVCPDNGQVTCVADINPLVPMVTNSCGTGNTVNTMGPTLVSGMQNQTGSVYEVVYTVTDLCGRTASCTQTYTITSDALTITCPADVIVDCVGDIVEGEANISSNCGGSVQRSVTGPTLISGQANCGGAVYGITYSAVNNVGATASCTQNFTLRENLPVLTCPAGIRVTCATEIVAEVPTYTLNCSGTAQVTSGDPVLVSGTANCDGAVYEITYTVTSNCGSSATCTQPFTISNAAPTIQCVSGMTASCAADITPIEPIYTVSCGETGTVTNSAPVLVSGEANCSGSVYEITYTVTDACNRTANCTQSIIINNDPLVVECPPTQVVSCFADIVTGTPTFTTSCGVTADVTTVGPTLFLGEENCNGAVYAVNYTVMDACGNSAVCEQLFAIENDAPSIQCPVNETVTCLDDIVLADNLVFQTSCAGESTVTANGPLLREGTPNCTGAVYVATYTVTDNCNRVASCEQTFTISNAAPSITCIADATVSCFADIVVGSPAFETSCGAGSLSSEGPTLIQGNDNCDGAVYSIIYTVSDACGRTATCTQNITLDQAMPTISCPANQVVNCESDIVAGEANFTISCGNFGLVTTEGPTLIAGTQACPQTYAITYTVEDECGRTASCSQEFSINNAPPTISCPADVSVTCSDDIVISAATFETSCNLGAEVTTVGPTLISGQSEAVGAVYELVYTATDACGATATCSRRFTIQNNAPLISCPSDAIVTCAADIQIGSPITSISCDGTGSLSTVGPNLVSGQPDCNGAVYQVVYSVTDGSGRTENCTQTFTVVNDGPSIVCPDSKIVSCEAEIVEETIFVSSSCGVNATLSTVGPVLVNGDANCSGATYEIRYTATDDCGRTASCTQSFILDNAEPTITCVDAEVVTCIENITDETPQYTTSCGLGASIVTEGPTLIAGVPNCNGALYNIVYSVVDDCGRTASCTKTISIANDIQLVCPMDKLVTCFDELVAETPTYTIGCGQGGTLSVDGPNLVSGDMFCGGSIYSFTYTVTDNACGRTTSCTQEMTVINCDSDGDGICDPDDVCMGYDDSVDNNANGIPDGCETVTPACPDSDNDGVCDADDICIGADDNLDTDGNGIPDGCDNCENVFFNFTHPGNSWHDGDLTGSLSNNGQCANINISDPYHILQHTQESGGGLMIGMDPKNVNQSVNICYDLCNVSDNISFTIRDLDYKRYGYKSSNQQEAVCVNGYLNGSEVLPQLSSLNGSVKITGNVAEATTDSRHGKDESILVEFDQCIDQVCIKYGTGSNSPVVNPTYGKIYIGEGNGIFAEFCDVPCDGGQVAQACSNEYLNFQNSGVNWATNATSGVYTVGNQTYTINIEDADRILEDTYEHGQGLLIGIEPKDVHDEVVITYNFSTIANDVSFKIRDLDRKHYGNQSSNQQEAVCVYGYLNGVLVNPNISLGEGHINIQGNCAQSTVNSADSGQEESVMVSFDQCIDEVKIVYGTGSNSPVANPTYSKIYIGEGLGFFTGVCGNECGNVQPCSDVDLDGVCDEVDICPNFDDSIDTDGDGIPDACDLCDCTCIDSDLDGVCDEDDVCPGSNDNVDMNNNGIPDGCECPTGDSDRDGVCDGDDQCPGLDDFSDACQNGLAVNNCNNFIAAPSITGVLDETLIVSWLGDGSTIELQYRAAGESTWQSHHSTDGYAVLSLLRICTDYQLRLKSSCNGSDIFSPIKTTTTTGCIDCSAADLEMFVFNVEGTSAILAWDVVPGTIYRLHYKEIGESSYKTYTTPIPFVVLLGLNDCTSYEFALSVYCQDGVQSDKSVPISFTTTNCKGEGGDITLSDNHSISIYPNPAVDQIEIRLSDETEADVITIYNAAGQIMLGHNEINFDGVVYKTNINHLSEGIYFVMTVNGDTVETKQFIVK